jgi:hypothetical protein
VFRRPGLASRCTVPQVAAARYPNFEQKHAHEALFSPEEVITSLRARDDLPVPDAVVLTYQQNFVSELEARGVSPTEGYPVRGGPCGLSSRGSATSRLRVVLGSAHPWRRWCWRSSSRWGRGSSYRSGSPVVCSHAASSAPRSSVRARSATRASPTITCRPRNSHGLPTSSLRDWPVPRRGRGGRVRRQRPPPGRGSLDPCLWYRRLCGTRPFISSTPRYELSVQLGCPDDCTGPSAQSSRFVHPPPVSWSRRVR